MMPEVSRTTAKPPHISDQRHGVGLGLQSYAMAQVCRSVSSCAISNVLHVELLAKVDRGTLLLDEKRTMLLYCRMAIGRLRVGQSVGQIRKKTAKPIQQGVLAERVGFEPTVPITAQRLSRPRFFCVFLFRSRSLLQGVRSAANQDGCASRI